MMYTSPRLEEAARSQIEPLQNDQRDLLEQAAGGTKRRAKSLAKGFAAAQTLHPVPGVSNTPVWLTIHPSGNTGSHY